jgi:hypothetical protein
VRGELSGRANPSSTMPAAGAGPRTLWHASPGSAG